MQVNLKIEEKGEVLDYWFGIEDVVITSEEHIPYVRIWIDLELEKDMSLVELKFFERRTLDSYVDDNFCELDFTIFKNWGINGSNFIVDVDTIRYGREDG